MKHGFKWSLFAALISLLIVAGCKDKDQKTLNYTDEQGQKQGKWVAYYPPDSTQLKWEAYYEDDEKVGEEKLYYRDGMIEKLMTWKADSVGSDLDGPYLQFYPNGHFMEQSYFKRGMPDSTQKTYFTNGNIQLRAYYKNGLKVGTWIFYRESGSPFYTIDFGEFQPKWQEDIRTGVFTYLDPDSVPAYRTEWLYGSRISDTILSQAAFQTIQDQIPTEDIPIP